jgi:hypothetical protein
MKKTIIIAALALLALTSCSTQSQSPLKFCIYGEKVADSSVMLHYGFISVECRAPLPGESYTIDTLIDQNGTQYIIVELPMNRQDSAAMPHTTWTRHFEVRE